MLFIVLVCCIGINYAVPSEKRIEKAIGIFNIISFPNIECIADSTNTYGTCYTAEECSDRKGLASGSCADGLGVCCIITVGCGETTTENCTYLNLESTTTPEDCSYTICPRDSSINRIKLDMTAFSIAPPVAAPAAGTGIVQNSGANVGACITDTFSVSGGSGNAAPVICGENANQHMILDTDGEACITASFAYGGGATARMYNIHVVQYAYTNEMGGPPGCLQFYTGEDGAVRSFNWVAVSGTHLQNQDYSVCVRPLANMCVICWSPTITGVFGTRIGSFGISPGKSTAAATNAGGPAGTLSGTGAACATDYVIIQEGQDSNAAAPASGAAPNDPDGIANHAITSRFCGNYFSGDVAGEVGDMTVCTRQIPFRMQVVTDDSEIATTAAAVQDANTNEGSSNANPADTPRGVDGFSLSFNQIAC